MLSFAPPLRIIAGHPVFSDHLDPALFHVLPDRPRLGDGAVGLPDFHLTRFLGDGAGGQVLAGGFLSLGTRLAIPADHMTAIRDRIEDETGRPARLTPALFDEGRVELVLLGQGADTRSPFGVTVLGSGMPSMAGTNTATFQVQLDHPAAAFVEACIGDPVLPALVIYRMALTGVEPAYSIRIDADWSAVKHQIDSRFRANVYYARADVQTGLREAAQAAGLRVQSVVMDQGSAPDAAAAEKAMLDWITGSFFDPAHGADPPAPGGGLVEQIAGSMGDLIETLMPGASFRLKEVREEDLRRMAATLDRSTARRRDLAFQATLGAELHDLRIDDRGQERPDWPATRDRLVTGVNIAGLARREVQVGVTDRFASDGLSAVEIDLRLVDPATGAGRNERTLAFHDAADREIWAVNLLGEDPALLTLPYDYRLRVHFDPASPFGALPATEGPWAQGRAPELVADPRIDGPYRLCAPVIGVMPGFPFAQFPQVLLDLRKGADQSAMLALTAETPEIRWTFRGTGAGAAEFDWRVTYDRPAAQGGPVVRDWETTAATRLTLPDPLPDRRQATFFADLPWPEVMTATLEVRMDDPARGRILDERIPLTADAPLIGRDYAVPAGSTAPLMFRLAALVRGRGLVQGDWRETGDTIIPLGRDLFEMRAIRFRVLGLPLAGHRLSQLSISAEALAPDGARLHDFRAERRAADTAGDLGIWSFPRFAPAVARLRLRADWRDPDGFPGDTGWIDWTRDLALFRLPQREFAQ
ncbi:MAG: hypothetical protein QM656_11425 [Paracoccaceae bacterium]